MSVTSAICDSRMTLAIMPKAPGSVNAAEPPKCGHPRDSVNGEPPKVPSSQRKRGSILRPVNNQWIPAYAGHCHGSIAAGRPVEVRIASLNPRKQVVTLLDEPLAITYGFWKTICTCGRSRLSVARLAWATSLPRSRSSPEVGRSIMVSCRASVDLPQPDSPTIASVSPSRTLKDTPSRARTSPFGLNGPRETT